MDKTDSKNNLLKISFLEINPPINELAKSKEELNIIFQGHDNFYDFKKCLLTKTPILLNRYKKSLIMTLLKSNNIFATGLFTVRQGEQNVIFNYENKKKISSTKAVNINNILECIKIKILCEFEKKDKAIISNINNSISENSNNNSANKYVPKVNLMKSNHLNNNAKIKNNNKKIYEKKKKIFGNFSINNNNNIKKNFINSSQEFSLGTEYSAILTEDLNNNLKQSVINNFTTNEIKKLNPYCSSKLYNNLTRKTDIEMSAKGKDQLNREKSKNYFSTIKKQYKQNFGNQIKMNNSSMNLINQKNNLNSIDNAENYNSNNNATTNRIVKPTISFNKNNKRNLNNNKVKNINKNKNFINSIDNFISGQIIEHVDKSKNGSNRINTNSEKKNFVCINKSNFGSSGNIGMNNNENKKRKFNNNSITMNSVSTAGTKKNDLEFSINSLFDYKDVEDKNNINKNNFMPFTNRFNNERLQHKLNVTNSVNRNINKHKFNKSLCQQSFIDKIFNENDLNINVYENDKNNISNLCKSCDKLKNEDLNDLNLNKNTNEILSKINDKENNKDIKDFNKIDDESEEISIEMENYLRLKEDFNLLYNDEYIKQINEDLLKLEIELFFEKMSELFSTYHILMDEKILENQIIKRDYKKNISKYLFYIKLQNKLKFIKAQQQTSKSNLKDKGIHLGIQNLENVNINLNELSIFKLIFPEENKSKKLKKIISIILKKQGSKELLDDKLKMILK